MEHLLPELPYAKDALEPQISKETFEYHYGKHHKAYVDKLNALIKGTKFENLSLADIIMTSDGAIFNNAAQHWNHSFFWKCLSPKGGSEPYGKVAELIMKSFGSFEKFKSEFSKKAVDNFGSGWTWLVQNKKGDLEIMNTHDGDDPVKHHTTAILGLDVWEHAYYIDYRNSRVDFVDAFFKVINWDFANENLN